MATTLVIVESPAKAKTIQRFLDDSDALEGDIVVEASVGHIRDLPARAADVPESQKRQWEILGIEVDNDFKPLYVISPDKRDRIRDLKRLMKDATELYLATDEDREGEAISWHLLEVLNPPASMPVKRMVFHEITPAAIRHAMDNPRDIDRRLVDAQEARRLLDRIYGYGPLADVARAVAELPARPDRHVSVREIRLWNLWWLLPAIAALMAADWFLRRRSGLVM